MGCTAFLPQMATSTQYWCYFAKMRIFFYTLIISVLLPILILISVPFLIFRQLHQFWATKLCHSSNNGFKILSPLAQIGAHDFRQLNPRLNIVVCIIGDGEMSIENFQDLVQNSLIESNRQDGQSKGQSQGQNTKIRSRSNSEYSELTCKVVKINGYFYWQKLQHFNIKDYVRSYYPEEGSKKTANIRKKITTECDLKRIVAHLASKPWDFENGSPWEFSLINNYCDDNDNETHVDGKEFKSVIILRLHHHMADGYSILNIIKRLSAGNFRVSAAPNSNLKRKVTRFHGLRGKFLSLVMFPYNVALMIEELTGPKINIWRLSPEQFKNAGTKYFQNWSAGIPLDTVKGIKNKFGVSFQAVLNSLFGGAIHSLMRSTMKMKEQSSADDVNENNEMSAFLPIPLPRHPGGLSNHVGYLLIRLPVGDVDPVKRLDLADQELSRLSNTTFPIISFIVYSFIGLFPTFVTGHVTSFANVGNSFLFSPFPGLDGVHYIGSLKTAYALFTLGTGWGDAGGSITTCSTQGILRFGIMMDQHLCPSEDMLYKFNEFIQNEIQYLLENPVQNHTKTG